MAASSSSPTVPFKPTVGIELQFILYVRKDSSIATNISAASPAAIIQTALKGKLKVICEHCAKVSTFELLISDDERNDEREWRERQVVHEGSTMNHLDEIKLLGEDWDLYHAQPLELQSRVLDWNSVGSIRKSCGHTLTASEEITGVLNQLHDKFRDHTRTANIPRQYYLHLNTNCGFHVHISDDEKPVQFTAAQRLMCLFVALERQIDQLHSRDCITGFDLSKAPHSLPREPFPFAAVLDDETHNLPLSMMLMADAYECRWHDRDENGSEAETEDLADEALSFVTSSTHISPPYTDDVVWSSDRLTNIDAWLVRIRSCRSILELRNLFSAVARRCHFKHEQLSTIGKDCTVNLDNLPDEIDVREDRIKRGTIEFRQHRSTIEPAEVLSFIDFAVKILTFCTGRGEGVFDLIGGTRTIWRAPTFSTQQLLLDIKCLPATRQHYSNVFDHSTVNTSQSPEGYISTLEQFAPIDPMIRLNIHTQRVAAANTSRSAVRERIQRKLRSGGYGQFHGDYLRQVLPHEMTHIPGVVNYLHPLYVAELQDSTGDRIAAPGIDLTTPGFDAPRETPETFAIKLARLVQSER